MIGVGIIGLGHVAAHQIAAIEQSPNFNLLAGCDLDQERHSLLGESAKAFVSTSKFLEECDDLDVVVVASPNRLHVEHGVAIMEAGKWILMEKPLAESPEAFERFVSRKQELSANCTIALHAAFGVETEWYCGTDGLLASDLDNLTSIHSSFDDPYVRDSRLLPQARSLGGSWLDSGINALSVICRFVDPGSIVVERCQMTRDDQGRCSELDSSVEYSFKSESGTGFGRIQTSWLTGRDRKVTSLEFDEGDRTIVLDHSEQRVVLSANGVTRCIFENSNGLSRLTNHYIGVFSDLARQIESGIDNFDYCEQLHGVLYEAERRAS